jgi:hypothetical protein
MDNHINTCIAAENFNLNDKPIKSEFKQKEWRNNFEKTRFDLEGNCYICGRQQYLHCEPTIKKCINDFITLSNN